MNGDTFKNGPTAWLLRLVLGLTVLLLLTFTLIAGYIFVSHQHVESERLKVEATKVKAASDHLAGLRAIERERDLDQKDREIRLSLAKAQQLRDEAVERDAQVERNAQSARQSAIVRADQLKVHRDNEAQQQIDRNRQVAYQTERAAMEKAQMERDAALLADYDKRMAQIQVLSRGMNRNKGITYQKVETIKLMELLSKRYQVDVKEVEPLAEAERKAQQFPDLRKLKMIDRLP